MLLWFADYQNSTTFKLVPPGMAYYVMVLFLQTFHEALIVTGASASCLGEQYRDLLLLDLHQELDENNS